MYQSINMIFKAGYPKIPQPREAIQASYLMDETVCVSRLLSEFSSVDYPQTHIHACDDTLVRVVRENNQSYGGLNAFLQQYDLSSQEGVVLLCLAEALLRIPDAETADQLIRDKLAGANWEQHMGQSQSWFVNAGTWGLMLTGKVISLDRATQLDPLTVINNMMARLSEPVIRTALKEAMRIMGHQFVMGRSIEEAWDRSQSMENNSTRCRALLRCIPGGH